MKELTFDEYQDSARVTAFYPDKVGLIYTLLGMIGELGEIVEKVVDNVSIETEPGLHTELQQIMSEACFTGKRAEITKKRIRDSQSGIYLEASLSLFKTTKTDLLKETGDLLWYIANFAQELDCNFNTVAQLNLEKLASRANRGKLLGNGDNR